VSVSDTTRVGHRDMSLIRSVGGMQKKHANIILFFWKKKTCKDFFHVKWEIIEGNTKGF